MMVGEPAAVLVAVPLLGAILLGAILLTKWALDRRGGGPSGGGDVIAYLLMALAAGVTGFALAGLGRAAFPVDSFAVVGEGTVAAWLAALVVAAPIAVFLWRRQSSRRQAFPRPVGWAVYLTLMEAVFLTSFVAAAFIVLNWALGDGDAPPMTDAIVFGGVVVFHEAATRRSPAASDLPRVVGSAIGLVTLVIGAGGALLRLFEAVYATITPTAAGAGEIGWAFSLILIGAPIWLYRWLRAWPGGAGLARNAWLFIASVSGLIVVIVAGASLLTLILIFALTDAGDAGTHFAALPAFLAVSAAGAAVWAHHRLVMGAERTNTVRSYEYAMSAVGLCAGIGGLTALTDMAFTSGALVGPFVVSLIAATVGLATAVAVWSWFWSRIARAPRESEASALPRRFYMLGLSTVAGLVAAGSLIAALVVVFRRLLGAGGGETLVVPAALSAYSALAAWRLLRVNAQDRELTAPVRAAAFKVTVVCSRPGMIAEAFPKEARLRVLLRGDETGVIDDETAAAIVDEVAGRPALVWVDEEGFRVAPAR